MDLNHDIELGHVPYPSDAPPSPNGMSDNPTVSIDVGTSDNFMRTASGRKIDRRLWVYAMSSLFTFIMIVFAMVMIAIGRDTGIWLPIITFATGVWTGQLALHAGAKTKRKPPKSPSSSPAQ